MPHRGMSLSGGDGQIFAKIWQLVVLLGGPDPVQLAPPSVHVSQHKPRCARQGRDVVYVTHAMAIAASEKLVVAWVSPLLCQTFSK